MHLCADMTMNGAAEEKYGGWPHTQMNDNRVAQQQHWKSNVLPHQRRLHHDNACVIGQHAHTLRRFAPVECHVTVDGLTHK